MLPSWLVDLLFWGLVAAIAVAAYRLRRHALFCLAVLAFLPFAPAALRFLLADPAVTIPDGAGATRVFVIAAMSFVPVWVGFAAGLLFDWLNTGIPAAQVAAETKPAPELDANWRQELATTPPAHAAEPPAD